MRTSPVMQISLGTDAGAGARAIADALHDTMGKTASLIDVLLQSNDAGLTVAAAAVAPGTALTTTRHNLDFADAGTDQVRLVVRGKNSAPGSVIVTLYDVSNSVELARCTLTDATEVTTQSEWTTVTPSGSDHAVEVRVIGNGAFSPVLFNVHVQLRTLQARR